MVVATWNVNSIRSRLPRVIAWLQAVQPDVLCLQEIKTEQSLFPYPPFWALGYQVAAWGEITYNGVAIVTRRPMSEVMFGLGDGKREEARLIAATIDGVRIISAYVPHGQDITSEMYRYKVDWLERLRAHLDARYDPKQDLVLCGDFNVAPESRDVHDPKGWASKVHFHADARVALKHVTSFGLHDTFRIHHAQPGLFSWWDYKKKGGFEKNLGLRIDHLWATESLAKRCTLAAIDRAQRAGEHPSDHAPALAAFG